MCLHIGDEVFAGLLLDGQPWSGAHGRAGAAGVARAESRRAPGLSQARQPRRGNLGEGHRAAAVVARPGGRPLAGARQRRRLARGDHRRSSCSRARAPATASRFPSCATPRSTSAWRSRRSPRRSIPRSSSSAAASPTADLMLEPVRQECARRLPPDGWRICASSSRRSAPDAIAIGAARLALTAQSGPDDPAVGRGSGPAGPRARRRHARARRRSHRRDRRRRSPTARAQARRTSPSPITTSSPASSTSTCTASRGPTRSTAATAIATMAERLPRFGVTGVLPDVARLRSAVAAADAGRRPHRADDASARRRARAAGASREQLHQPAITKARSRSTACGCRRRRQTAGAEAGGQPRRRAALDRRRHPRRDRRRAAGRRHHHPRARDRRRARADPRRSCRTATTCRSAIRARPTSRRRPGSAPARRQATHLFNRMTPLVASRARACRRGPRVRRA